MNKAMKKLYIKNGQIKTMTGREFVGSILIEGTKITALGETLPEEVPSDAVVIDALGCIVLPGFIDAHCHVGIGGRDLSLGRGRL